MSVSQMGRRWCSTGGFLLHAGGKWALMECDTLLASTYAHPHIQSAASHALSAWWAALLCSSLFSQIKRFSWLQIYTMKRKKTDQREDFCSTLCSPTEYYWNKDKRQNLIAVSKVFRFFFFFKEKVPIINFKTSAQMSINTRISYHRNGLSSSRTSALQLEVSTKKRTIKLVLTSKIKATLLQQIYLWGILSDSSFCQFSDTSGRSLGQIFISCPSWSTRSTESPGAARLGRRGGGGGVTGEVENGKMIKS